MLEKIFVLSASVFYETELIAIKEGGSSLIFSFLTLEKRYAPVVKGGSFCQRFKIGEIMHIKKILFFLFMLLSVNVSAEIIYKELNKPTFDLTDIPISKLEKGASFGDKKSIYLLALHKIRDDQGDKHEGVKMLEDLANSGILDANETLYEISSQIEVESLTKEKALAYLRGGAEGGYAVSQFELAIVYKKGELVNKDLQQYHYWVEKAAEQGHEEAMAMTASDYFIARGIPQNDTKGFQWLIKSYNVLGRDFKRWSMLAVVYETGRGTPIDLAKAYMCYDLQGTAGIEEKERIASHMTEEQKAEGLRLSEEWQEKNHVYTMQSLGLKHQQDGRYQ